MSKDGGEAGTQDAGANGAPAKDPNGNLYENRGSKKLIRVVTVLAYMFSVSFVAIVLSAYYIFLWQPPNPRLMHKLHMEESPQFEYFVADSPIIVSKHGQSEVDGSAGKDVLALEIPLRSETNATLTGRGAFQGDLDQPRIVFDKTTFGREVPTKKSLSVLRNSLVEALRDRRGNISSHQEVDRDSEGTYSSREMNGGDVYESTSGRPFEESSEASATPDHSGFTAGGGSILSKFISVLRGDRNRNDEKPGDPTRQSTNGRLENKSSTDIQPTVNVSDLLPARNFRENTTGASHAASISRRETKDDDLRRDTEAPRKMFVLRRRSRMQLPRKMSAHNVMASISRTLGNRESKPAVGNEIRFAGEERKDKLYEPKHKQKLVRVLTVVAYVIFVSMAAILLSLYYTFLWDPKDLAVKVPRPNKLECDASKLTSSFTASTVTNETQIEVMTVKPSATSIVEQLESSEKINDTTERKDILTILTRLAETNLTPSTLSTLTTFKDDVAELATTLENHNNTVPA